MRHNLLALSGRIQGVPALAPANDVRAQHAERGPWRGDLKRRAQPEAATAAARFAPERSFVDRRERCYRPLRDLLSSLAVHELIGTRELAGTCRSCLGRRSRRDMPKATARTPLPAQLPRSR